MARRLLVGMIAIATLGWGCEAGGPDTEPSWRHGDFDPFDDELADANALKPREPLPQRPLVVPAEGDYRLVVKFGDDVVARQTPDGGIRSRTGYDLHKVETLQREHALSLQPEFRDISVVERLTERAERESGRAQPDLQGIFVVEPEDVDDDHMLELARAFAALDEVEYAAFEVMGTPPPADVFPPTPNLVGQQAHLGTPNGLDANGAWAQGYSGAGLRIADVEYAWNLSHEEFNQGGVVAEPGQTPQYTEYAEHGTASLGAAAAPSNGYGVNGIAFGASRYVYTEWSVQQGYRRPEAIAAAAAPAPAGTIILLEMQAVEPTYNSLGPAELDEAVFLVTRMATDANAIVVAAAGNGPTNLDASGLAYYRARGDSGAIIVGAGHPSTHDRLSYSTFGNRVDVQGWGSSVRTAGYGDLAQYGGDPNQRYTAAFNGTSSASALVAGAAALIQQGVIARQGIGLTPTEMRGVMVHTGIPQGAGFHIGPLPQIPEAIDFATQPTGCRLTGADGPDGALLALVFFGLWCRRRRAA